MPDRVRDLLERLTGDEDVDFGDASSGLDGEERQRLLEIIAARCRRQRTLLDISQAIGRERSLDALFPAIISRTSRLLRAERASVFLIDRRRGELYTKVAEGLDSKTIRIPRGAGIVGRVVETGELLNIEDAYENPLFNRGVDRDTGFRTRSVLCAPLRLPGGEIIGAVQAINRQFGEPFGREEEQLVEALGPVFAMVLENASLHEEAVARRREVEALLDAASALSRDLDLDRTIATIMERATEFMDAERSSLFVLDRERGELWTRAAQGMDGEEIRIPAGAGIAGRVASTGETLNIPDAYEHELFNRDVDRATGFRTRSLLTMPLRGAGGEIIGVTQVINKRDGVFGEDDERRFDAFTSQSGAAVDNARLFRDVRDMKEFLESVVRSITDGVVTVDRDAVVTMVNDAARRMLGHPGDVAGRPLGEVLGEANSFAVDLVMPVLETGEPEQRYDQELVTAEGDSSVNVNVVPLFDAEAVRIGAVCVFEDVTREKRIKSNLSRYMSHDLVDRLLQNQMALGGVRQQVTILFSDIRSFTTLTEKSDAADVVAMLNEYFEYMVDAVFDNDGILDKYIGDAIMAVFGVPFAEASKDARDGVRAALRMLSSLEVLNEARAGRGQEAIRIGVGLSTGEVLSGNIGTDRRMEYTVIGDGVNLASRLEGATKHFGAAIIVSEFTREQLGSEFRLRELDRIRVKGKKVPVGIFEVRGAAADLVSEDEAALLEGHARALALYRNRDWPAARDAFAAVAARFPDDRTTTLYLSRCETFAADPPPADWDGAWTMTEK